MDRRRHHYPVWGTEQCGGSRLAGGYRWRFRLFQENIQPLFCLFVRMVTFTVIQTATISSLAYVFAQSLNSIVPIPEIFPSIQHFSIGGVFFPFQDFGVKLTAIVLILLLTGLNISGLKSGAGTSKAILMLVGAGLLVIVVFGLSHVKATPANFMDVRELTNGAVTLSSFYTAMLAAFWAYQGWVSVGFIGGEVKDPKKISREELSSASLSSLPFICWLT